MIEEQSETDKKIDIWFDKLNSFRNSSIKIVTQAHIIALKSILKELKKEEKEDEYKV